jgi:hypothetical protein
MYAKPNAPGTDLFPGTVKRLVDGDQALRKSRGVRFGGHEGGTGDGVRR